MAESRVLSSHPPFPEKVGKYELLLPIGTGGMATVYLARNSGVGGFERDVALKLVHAHLRTDEESKLQLLEEAKLAALIRHPNVVPVLDVDEDPLGLFLVMDYVEGDTLSGLARASRGQGKPLTLPLIARILNEALLGLHAAHELCDSNGRPLNLVHRDFSPQNILLSVQGITRLADFGVAKAADRAVRTKTGLVKGKISYMSPEQARGKAIDRRCDVWAAGVVAWELIAGRRMHRSDDDVATLLSIVTEDPPRLRSVVPNVPKALDEAISWALTPDVHKRCPTAEELRKAFAKAFEESAGIADAEELGRFVRQVVGPKLEERKASVSEVRTLRRRMVELASARAEESDAEAAPSPPRASVERTRVVSSAEQQSGPGFPSLRPSTSPQHPGGAAASAGLEREPDEMTLTSAAVPLFETARRDRKRLLIGSLAAVTLMVALGLALGGVENTDGPSAAPGANTAAAPAATTPAKVATEAGSLPLEPVAEPSAAAASLTEQAQPDADPPAVDQGADQPQRQKAKRRRATTKPASKSKSRLKKPGLADSPYDAPKSGN